MRGFGGQSPENGNQVKLELRKNNASQGSENLTQRWVRWLFLTFHSLTLDVPTLSLTLVPLPTIVWSHLCLRLVTCIVET